MSPAAERLLATARTTFETMNIEVGPGVIEVVEGLAATAARTLEVEGRSKDEDAIQAAQTRLVYVLSTASLGAQTPEPDIGSLQRFPSEASYLEASALTGFLDGICPLWPFCV